jgi:histone H3/H4
LLVLQESLKFARHAKRNRLKVEDIDYALKARNIEVSGQHYTASTYV